MDNTLSNLEDLQRDYQHEQKSKDEQIKELEQQLKDMKLRNKLLRDRPDLPIERLEAYDELMQQNAELVAHCEYLKECCYMLGNGMKVDLDKVKQTPKQSLNNHDVDVVQDLLANIQWTNFEISLKSQIEYYANQLREQD